LPHTIASGPVKNEDYGLDLARRFLPERVVKNAEQVSTFLRDKSSSHAAGPATRAAKQSKLVLALPDLLKQADTSTMDDSALSSYINKLQTEFTIRMYIEADDDAQEEQTGESSKQALERPVLDKPSEGELEEWNKKCEAAERRIMHANMAQSQEKKRPASAGESSEYGQKRNKTEDPDDTQSMASQFTLINRGAMIESLRRGACTPTTRAETPSSVTMSDLPGSNLDAPVVGERMAREATPHPALDRGHQHAVSISSVNTTYDHDMPDVEGSEDARPASSERPGAEAPSGSVLQPLERFQPLREWYSRNSEGQASVSSGGISASEGGSTPASLHRSRSITQEFLGFMDGDGDKERRYN
jgi:DNA mismatch repair protein MSH4